MSDNGRSPRKAARNRACAAGLRARLCDDVRSPAMGCAPACRGDLPWRNRHQLRLCRDGLPQDADPIRAAAVVALSVALVAPQFSTPATVAGRRSGRSRDRRRACSTWATVPDRRRGTQVLRLLRPRLSRLLRRRRAAAYRWHAPSCGRATCSTSCRAAGSPRMSRRRCAATSSSTTTATTSASTWVTARSSAR